MRLKKDRRGVFHLIDDQDQLVDSFDPHKISDELWAKFKDTNSVEVEASYTMGNGWTITAK